MLNSILLIISVLIGGMGQILFKQGMIMMGKPVITASIQSIFSFLLKIITSPVLLLGMLCYILSTIVWMYVLSRVDLNRVYPFTALTFVVVFLASMFIFHEVIPPNRFIGVGLIMAGFLVVSIK
jgi:multidrug transporter EmrE-like cation transporter